MSTRRSFRSRTLSCESLENRRVLATFQVLTNADGGPGSLREAIVAANASIEADRIEFAITGPNKTITLETALPFLAGNTTLDARTQPGFVDRPVIRLDGSLLPQDASGLVLAGSGNIIAGLSITNFSTGVWLGGSGFHRVEANFIGLAPDQTAAGNLSDGIYVDQAPENVVSGNVISANRAHGVRIDGVASEGTRLSGNNVGTDLDGQQALPNLFDGILVSESRGIIIGVDGDGADDAQEGNLVSGNARNGIRIFGSAFVKVSGNIIGANSAGASALANSENGILVDGFSTEAILGTDGDDSSDALEANLISGNAQHGVRVHSSTFTTIAGNLIGTTISGLAALPNLGSGILVSGESSITIIGTNGDELSDAVEGNVISGNQRNGVWISNSNLTTVAGNLIGVGMDGLIQVANGEAGVCVNAGSQATVIGTNEDDQGDDVEGNVISGNGGDGILASDANLVRIAGNLVGTDFLGLQRLANKGAGIAFGDNVTDSFIGLDIASSESGVARNLVSGNNLDGIHISGTASEIGIAGNWIGLAMDGMAVLPNGGSGISLGGGASFITIGEVEPQHRNVISGNVRHGVHMHSGASQNFLIGNYVGLAADGQTARGNLLSGVTIEDSIGNEIGFSIPTVNSQNVIAHNGQIGIAVLGNASVGNLVHRNLIFGHSLADIDLAGDGPTINDIDDADSGPNQLQNYPNVLLAATDGSRTHLVGELQSSPNANFALHFYAKPSVSTTTSVIEYIGSLDVATPASGKLDWSIEFPIGIGLGKVVFATASDLTAGSSEFSPSVTLNELQSLPISTNQLTVTENAGNVQATISRGNLPLNVPLVVGLRSSDTTLATVPAEVQLPAGVQSQTFDLTLVDDLLNNSQRNVTIFATALGYGTGSLTLMVDDNESPWHNFSRPFDVNNDGFITALDALLVIGLLNRVGAASISDLRVPTPRLFADTNNDTFVTPVDVLRLIAELNRRRSSGSSEGEGAPVSVGRVMAWDVNVVDTFYAEFEWSPRNRALVRWQSTQRRP